MEITDRVMKQIEIMALLTVQETQNININLLALNLSMSFCSMAHLTLDSHLDKGVAMLLVAHNISI